ncbi:MAG: ABC transporter ATP-binding protein [Eubacteriales bacterium]|nr:ABC transporter ATP-binding protein [Eubacteriales bacterium]
MLECNNITKRYMNKTAVDHVNLSLDYGRIYALLGSNGSGKSTFMKMITGLIKPNEGSITLDGNSIGVTTKKHVAYMPTESYFYPYMTCIDIGKYYADFFEDFSYDKYMNMLSEMQLEPNQKASKMSSGMLAKLKLAVTLSRNAHVIMLDEPLNGIDIIAREHIINAIIANSAPDRIIILSSHLVDELEPIIDYAIFIKDGIVVSHGDAEALREKMGKSIVDQYKEIFA